MKKMVLVSAGAVMFSAVLHAQKEKSVDPPAVVKSVFMKKFPSATSVKWSMENSTEFEAEFKNSGMKQAANFDQTGKWVVTETEIKKSEFPAPVAKVIATDLAGYKIGESEKVEKPNTAMYYEVTAKKNGKTYAVEISPDGKILKKAEEKEEKD